MHKTLITAGLLVISMAISSLQAIAQESSAINTDQLSSSESGLELAQNRDRNNPNRNNSNQRQREAERQRQREAERQRQRELDAERQEERRERQEDRREEERERQDDRRERERQLEDWAEQRQRQQEFWEDYWENRNRRDTIFDRDRYDDDYVEDRYDNDDRNWIHERNEERWDEERWDEENWHNGDRNDAIYLELNALADYPTFIRITGHNLDHNLFFFQDNNTQTIYLPPGNYGLQFLDPLNNQVWESGTLTVGRLAFMRLQFDAERNIVSVYNDPFAWDADERE